MIPLVRKPLSGTFAQGSVLLGYKSEDLYLLAKIIHAEARGENLEGKIAVGAVVLNRVKDERFPDTIEEVILQPKQFSSVDDGQFMLEPDENSYKAAFECVLGKDPTDGCVFFYNPDIATAKWSFQRKTEIVIGRHHFTK